MLFRVKMWSLNKDFPRIRLSLVILRIGTVPFGQQTFSSTWMDLVGEIVTLISLFCVSKFGFLYKKKRSKEHRNIFNIVLYFTISNTNIEIWKMTILINYFTCNLWFFSKGWSKAGWLLISTQSTIYPDIV
jgi:hypothetical protein